MAQKIICWSHHYLADVSKNFRGPTRPLATQTTIKSEERKVFTSGFHFSFINKCNQATERN